MEKEGYTADDITRLGQLSNHANLLGVLRGTHGIMAHQFFREVINIDRSLTLAQAVQVTGRQLVDERNAKINLALELPKAWGLEEHVFFFNLNCEQVSNDHLEREYKARGLQPCDPLTLCKFNQDNPAFADEYPNSTHWENGSGAWADLAFDSFDGKKRIWVNSTGCGWGGCGWWFAGVHRYLS